MSVHPRVSRGEMAADVLQRDFTQIHNRLFRDPRISFKAKGVFGLISTHRDGYGVTPEWIAAASTDGVSAVKTALRELERTGYLERHQERAADGRVGIMTYRITDMPRSEPVSENPPPVLTCDDATTGRSGDETDKSRSEPVDENPPAADPPAADRTPKKTSTKNTQSEEDQRTDAPSARSALDARRAPTGSRARAASGSAASSKAKPARVKADSQQRAAVRTVLAGFPAELDLPPRTPQSLTQAILDALAAGQPGERTVEQLRARIASRWLAHGHADRYAAGTLVRPVGVAVALVRPLAAGDRYGCPDPRCEDGVSADTGEECRACAERIADRRRDRHKAAVPAPRPTGPQPANVPFRECDCGNPIAKSSTDSICGDCRESAAVLTAWVGAAG